MPIQCDESGGACVVTVKGDLTINEAAAVRATLDTRGDRSSLIFDLQSCHFLSSRGLEVLLEALRRCEDRGGRVMLVGLDENCRKILEMTRLDHRFDCHREIATAMTQVAQ